MYNERQLDNLIRSYITKQDELNIFILTILANRVKSVGEGKAVKLMERLIKENYDIKRINNKYLKFFTLEDELGGYALLYALFYNIAENVYLDTEKSYKANNIAFKAIKDNKDILDVITKITRETFKKHKVLANNPKLYLKHKGTKKLYTVKKAYQEIVNLGTGIRADDLETYNNIMQTTLDDLYTSGLRNDDGYPILPALQNTLNEAVKDLQDTVTTVAGHQFGSDGVELSVHLNPAEDHAPVQGHRFTFKNFERMQNGEDFEDINGVVYAGFPRAIGTCNCRHFPINVVLSTEPTYTNQQLQAILDDNNKGYITPDGRHLTLYQCSQKQRYYERQIRDSKEGYLIAKYGGNEDLMYKFEARKNKYIKQYKLFSRNCGLPTQINRTKVYLYDK